jgi:hypothetical protein
MDYTATLSATIAGSPATITVNALELDPIPELESEAYTDFGAQMHHKPIIRYKYSLKTYPYSTIPVTSGKTTEDFVTLIAFLRNAEEGTLQITGCTLDRWNDATNFPTLNAKFPIPVVLSSISFSLTPENAWNTLTLVFLDRNLL